MTRKSVRATLTEQLEIISILESVLQKVEGHKKLVEYVDNWSDSAVSDVVNDQFTASHTAKVRAERFGLLKLRKAQQSQEPDMSTLERFLTLELKMNSLETRITLLELPIFAKRITKAKLS
jgi:hypothetical protein